MELVSSSSATLPQNNSQQPSEFDGHQPERMQFPHEIPQSQKVSTSCGQLMCFLKKKLKSSGNNLFLAAGLVAQTRSLGTGAPAAEQAAWRAVWMGTPAVNKQLLGREGIGFF